MLFSVCLFVCRFVLLLIGCVCLRACKSVGLYVYLNVLLCNCVGVHHSPSKLVLYLGLVLYLRLVFRSVSFAAAFAVSTDVLDVLFLCYATAPSSGHRFRRNSPEAPRSKRRIAKPERVLNENKFILSVFLVA